MWFSNIWVILHLQSPFVLVNENIISGRAGLHQVYGEKWPKEPRAVCTKNVGGYHLKQCQPCHVPPREVWQCF
jgi:hypothetical protein